MKPEEALAYLDQIAAAFLQALPAPARGPTQQAAVQAIDVLKKAIEPKVAP